MEEVNIFLTQQRSKWFEDIMEQGRNNLGYENESWTTRAMIALKPAGLIGKRLTANEIELLLAPYIGLSENRHSVNNMVRRAIKRGIVVRAGRKRYVEGTSSPYPEYDIHGYLEIDASGGLHSIGGVREPNEGDDSRRERKILGSEEIRPGGSARARAG